MGVCPHDNGNGVPDSLGHQNNRIPKFDTERNTAVSKIRDANVRQRGDSGAAGQLCIGTARWCPAPRPTPVAGTSEQKAAIHEEKHRAAGKSPSGAFYCGWPARSDGRTYQQTKKGRCTNRNGGECFFNGCSSCGRR